MQNEESLVRLAKQGDKEAFAQLYEEYFDKIYRYIVLKMGNKTEAEDLTQQVFLKSLGSISSFKWQGVPFSSWLYRIAHNLVVDYIRKNSKHNIGSIDKMEIASDSNPQLEVERKLDIEQVLRAAQHLTTAQREVISLRFSSDLPIAEVARVMGKSQGAVKALQHSAIAALRKTLTVTANG